MERNKTKRKENELTAELTTRVEKNRKEEKMTTATEPKVTKQPKATQALKEPTEDKFLSAKDLAQMAGVAPAVLRSDFALTPKTAIKTNLRLEFFPISDQGTQAHSRGGLFSWSHPLCPRTKTGPW